jgi:hypothetical protein
MHDIAYPVRGDVEAAYGFRDERSIAIRAGRSVFGPTWCGNLDRQHASQEHHERESQKVSAGHMSPEWRQVSRRAHSGSEIFERDERTSALFRKPRDGGSACANADQAIIRLACGDAALKAARSLPRCGMIAYTTRLATRT